MIKSIQVAPYTKDCRVEDHKIIGTMGSRVFVFEIPSAYRIPQKSHANLIKCFQQAIAILSKQWQVAEVLNDTFGITEEKGQGLGKFYELKDGERLERVYVIQYKSIGGDWRDLEETEYSEQEANVAVGNLKTFGVNSGHAFRKRYIRTDVVSIASVRNL